MGEYTDHDEQVFVEDHDQVGTVDVQILLSWYFETADPSEVQYDRLEAA